MTPEASGSFADEVARLVGLVQSWVGTQRPGAAEAASADDAGHGQSRSDVPPPGDAGQAATADDDADEACRWCPICRLARSARSTSPETREHLANAFSSFALAFKDFFETPTPAPDEAEGQAGTGPASDGESADTADPGDFMED